MQSIEAIKGLVCRSIVGMLLLITCSIDASARSERVVPGDVVDVRDLYESGMSSFGLLAKMATSGRLDRYIQRARLGGQGRINLLKVEPPLEEEDDGTAIPGGQAEMAIAVDGSGNNVVVGFNDTRGFAVVPSSISGFAYSNNGGTSFTDGGQLPITQQGLVGTVAYPQTFGDADIKYVPGGAGCQFIYASILVIGINGVGVAPNIVYTGTAQTMSIHRSTDCGHTWTGPFEVTSATNPTGALNGLNSRDDADKEFIDVDPDTGRVLMSWSNFTSTTVIPGGIQILTSFSDNIMSATPPTWSSKVLLNPGATRSDTGSMPRFAGNGSLNAYVVWASRNFAGQQTPYTGDAFGNTMFSRSTDNGATWSVPIKLHTTGVGLGGDYFPMDQIPGNDRIHSFPSLAVDTTAGASSGFVYVVYSGNDSHDGGDIHFVRSINGGTSFSPPITLNARPGNDRSQWFPYVTVSNTGRVYVIWYDQQHTTTGDLTETMMTYSDDGGTTWKRPSPITDRPFHVGYGNDGGQPNIGDYIGATTSAGSLYSTWAGTPPSVSYTDGQPQSSFTVPNFYFAKVSGAKAALKLGTIAAVETVGFANLNGSFDPGERISLMLPLINYVTNTSAGAASYTVVSGTLTTTTPGVTITASPQPYGTIAAGATVSNAAPYIIQLPGNFVAGTKLDLILTAVTGPDTAALPFTLNTGTRVNPATPTFSENFNTTAVGSLPSGWGVIHGGGTTTVNWTTNSTFCNPGSNALFHVNANDAPTPTRFERVSTPNIAIPATAAPQIVTLDFDICYETEDDPDFNLLAYDGFTLRITDFTGGGRFARAVLAESFAEVIQTGASAPFVNHFPKHLPRNSSTAYFQDMSVWAGRSGGIKHVHMDLPGLQGSTVALRWEFTQDSSGICTDAHAGAGYGGVCGVMVDNIVMNAVTFNPAIVDLSFSAATAAPLTVAAGNNVTYTFTVAASNSGFNAASVTFTDPLPAGHTFVSRSAPGGWTCVDPAVGASGTITCTHPSMPGNSSATFTIVAKVPAAAPNGNITNTATVTTTSPETTASNNSGAAAFAIGIPSARVLDIDQNGSYSPLTDGLLVIRYMFGQVGAQLAQTAVGPGGVTDPAQLLIYLNSIRPQLDIDGDGTVSALTDGLLVLRYMFGLRGPTLIAGVVTAGSPRNTAPLIEAYILSLMP